MTNREFLQSLSDYEYSKYSIIHHTSKENHELKHRLSNLEQLIIKMMCEGKAE